MCLGVPGQIVDVVDAGNCIATVEVAGVRRAINLVCIVDDAHPAASCVGDWVLVHVGFAMSRIDPDEAAKTLALLRALGEMQAEWQSMQDETVSGDREHEYVNAAADRCARR